MVIWLCWDGSDCKEQVTELEYVKKDWHSQKNVMSDRQEACLQSVAKKVNTESMKIG